MKKMDFLRELRSLGPNELRKKREDLLSELITLKLKLREGLLKNPLQLRVMHRNIAIVNTILKERENQA